MKIRVQLKRSANSLSELSSAVDAFETVDELYRLSIIYQDRKLRDAIDFRRRPFKDSPGARVESFKITSPPDITINANSLWLAAIFVVMNYSTIKKNVFQIVDDVSTVSNAVVGLSKDEIESVVMGVKLLVDRLEDLEERKTKTLRRKIVFAHRWLNSKTIAKISKRK